MFSGSILLTKAKPFPLGFPKIPCELSDARELDILIVLSLLCFHNDFPVHPTSYYPAGQTQVSKPSESKITQLLTPKGAVLNVNPDHTLCFFPAVGSPPTVTDNC